MRTAMIQCGILSGHLQFTETLDNRASIHPSTIYLGRPRWPEALDLRLFIHPSTESNLHIAIDTP